MSVDIGARGLALRSHAVATNIALRGLGTVGSRMFGGRLSNLVNNAAALTFETLAAVAAPFDAVRLVFAAGQTNTANAASATMLASAAVVGEASDAAIAAASWTPVTVAGSGTWSLAPSSAFGRSKIVVSDWMSLPSMPRGDGGALPLIVVRAWVNGGNPIVLYGDGMQSFANWASHSSGRIWRVRAKPGNFASTNQTGFTAPGASNTGPLIGIQYLARGQVVTLWGFGDSITEGQGRVIGEGFGLPAAIALSANQQGVAYEWAQCAWSGASMSVIAARVADFASAGLLDIGSSVAVLPCGSPNDNAASVPAIGPGAPAAQRGYLAQMLVTLGDRHVQPIVWTWLPTNAAVRPYGASDTVRRAYLDEVRAGAARGLAIADFDAVIAGSMTATGQVEIAAGLTDDGIHPNDAGNARLWPVLAAAVQQIVPTTTLLVRG